jgi:hypothetical protein
MSDPLRGHALRPAHEQQEWRTGLVQVVRDVVGAFFARSSVASSHRCVQLLRCGVCFDIITCGEYNSSSVGGKLNRIA